MLEALPEPGPHDIESIEPQPALFDAVLLPSRSLSPRAFLALMTVVALIGFGSGAAFALAGAWPVFGFLGLDILLIYIAFRVNYRRARMYETVRLTPDSLVVERVSPSGDVQHWHFQPYWLRVDLDESLLPDSPLTVSSHGKSLEIGNFLSPEERLEVAEALRAALHELREPQFRARA